MDQNLEKMKPLNELDQKLKVLSGIANVLNKNNVIWAVGASMLLYFKGKTDVFHDIDIMVYEDDVSKLKELLLPMGILAPPNPNTQYKTRHFLEFTIDGVDVDVMAGFVIVKDEREYDCSLMPEQIAETLKINGETIPLQAVADWRRYYELMGRASKVEMIDR
ncbi:MAG: hypothetical protein PHR92_03440 [Lachnospiraceae bacterium]|nr:hypothetical protein [Lachnospiraceae bacterium]